MKNNAFFDVDYTIYNGYLGTNFSLFLVEHGYTDASVTIKEEQLLEEYLAGHIDYREAARRALQLTADCLKDQTVEQVREWQEQFVKDHNNLFDWVEPMMALLQQKGFEIYLISAAPTFLVEAVANSLGINHWYGSEFEIIDGRYTGNIIQILNYKEKHARIHTVLGKNKTGTTIGFGDSLGDVDMLESMDSSIIYKPKSQELLDLAIKNQWIIADENNILDYANKLLAKL